MFVKPQVLKRMMTQAYKGVGLTVARTESEELYVAGANWALLCKEKFAPKQTKGDLIALIGELPNHGEKMLCTEHGQQMEMCILPELRDSSYPEQITITNLIHLGESGSMLRLLQTEAGRVVQVNNTFLSAISPALIDGEQGESIPDGPWFNDVHGIMYRDNVCRFYAGLRGDRVTESVLDNLQGVDIRPEVPA